MARGRPRVTTVAPPVTPPRPRRAPIRATEIATFVALVAVIAGPLAWGFTRLSYPWSWWSSTKLVDGVEHHVPGAFESIVYRDDHGAWCTGFLLRGLGVTLAISVAALALSLPAGIALGVALVSPNRGLAAWARLYVETFRNSPLMIQVFAFYFALGKIFDELARAASLGGTLAGWRAEILGIGALTAFSTAYLGEIVRGGIVGLPPGQLEAARALGMSRLQALRHVVLPQAIRASLPAMAGQFVSLVKDSSLLSMIGILELTKRARELGGSNLMQFEIWILAAALYLAITLPLAHAVHRLERRLAR